MLPTPAKDDNDDDEDDSDNDGNDNDDDDDAEEDRESDCPCVPRRKLRLENLLFLLSAKSSETPSADTAADTVPAATTAATVKKSANLPHSGIFKAKTCHAKLHALEPDYKNAF